MSLRPLLLVLLLGCASAPPEPPTTTTTSTTAPATASELAPLPFTAEQLRAGNPAGRVYRFRTEGGGQSAVMEMRFDAVDDAGATITSRLSALSGAGLGPPSTQKATWTELLQHAAFPKNATTIEDKEVSVPAGTFACKMYTVRRDEGTVSHFCFVLDQPGPPAFFDSWKGEQQLTKNELVERGG